MVHRLKSAANDVLPEARTGCGHPTRELQGVGVKREGRRAIVVAVVAGFLLGVALVCVEAGEGLKS